MKAIVSAFSKNPKSGALYKPKGSMGKGHNCSMCDPPPHCYVILLQLLAPFAGLLDLVSKDEDQTLKVTSAGLRMFERKDQKVGHHFPQA